MPIFNNILAGASGQGDTGYDIDQSLRLDNAGADNSANYLKRLKDSWTSDGNQKTWTISWWMKWDNEDSNSERWIYWVDGDDATSGSMGYDTIILQDEQLQYYCYVNGWSSLRAKTRLNRVFRDPGAWYHCVLSMDSTLASTNDRLKLYVNGVRETSFATDSQIGQDQTTNTNLNANTYVGTSHSKTSTQSFGGYLAEFHRIDGQALGPEYFGETNSATNQWVPIEVTGMTYGTNGFYLPFSSTELANSFSDDSGGYLVPAGVTEVEVLVVAGGGAGSGGGGGGGGGGAGGLVYISNYSVTPGERINVTVGAGGAGRAAGQFGLSGENSVFGNITAIGGGGGGEYSTGKDGGSGGGGWPSSSTAGGSSTQTTTNAGYTSTGWGNAGGQGGSGTPNQGGGGGGAGAAGVAGKGSGGITSIPTGGNGGIGRAYTIADGSTSVYYAGGGGGGVIETGSSASDTGQGGSGGGGTGGYGTTGSYTEPTAGTANTGGGGGGGRNDGGGASGGSGVVIVYDGTTRTTFTSSTAPHTITANGDVTNTRAQKKIGSSSIKFDGSGDYLSTASSGMGLTGDYTIECWFNTASSTSDNGIISNKYNNSSFNGNFSLRLNDGGNSNDIAFRPYNGTVAEGGLVTSSTGAWSDNTWTHVAVVKSGSGTGNVKMYIDGSLAGTSSGESSSTILGNAGDLNIGRQESASAGTNYLNGYMDEIRISNTARYTSSFTPSTTAFTADSNTLLLIHSDFNGGLGADNSGNTNDFTPTNLAATDQVLDSPTNNFATLNPIYEDGSASSLNPIFAEGNLSITATDGNFHVAYSTITIPASGKWYLETYLEDGDIDGVGIVTASGRESVANGWGMGAVTTAQGFATQANYVNNSSSNNFTLGTGTPSNGDICQLAIDADNNKVWIGLNNSWNDASGGTTGNPSSGTNHTIALTFGSDAQIGLQKTNASPNTGMVANFGQDSSFAGNKTAQGNQDGNGIGDFYYTPPTGFKALCSDNLSDPSIADPTKHFNTNLWTGNGSTGQSINVGFQPDFLWTKERAETTHHGLRNSVTGVTKTLSTSITSITEQTETDGVTAFTSTGFNLSGDGYFYVNRTGKTMVGWSWKAGGTASSNSDGSITSSVSANTDAGFSIVSYTGNSTAGATVGHGLSQAPELVIAKERTNADSWLVFSEPLGNTKALFLNENSAAGTHTTYWNDTSPSSTVVTLGSDNKANGSGTIIMYCFHSVDGYSKVGSYTGNASTDGPFVYTGFRPAWVMLKNSTTGGGGYSWVINDSKRVGYNADNKRLRADTSGIEDDTGRLDIFSNGFKLTQTYTEANQSGATFIYLAFAESPFKYSNAR